MGAPIFCPHCGQALPEWPDIAGALEEVLTEGGNIPPGLRAMLLQAIRELRTAKSDKWTV
jgi:hypothetical protein